jgi:phosphatidate phosphatase PAH1
MTLHIYKGEILMKFNKKLLSIIVATSLVFGTSVTAFAATNNEVITALTSAGADSTTISTATSYLNSHSSSASSLDTVVSEIKAVQAKGVTSLAQYNALSTADKAIVAADIKAAASALGITITKNADGTFTATDSTGTVIETIGTTGTTAGVAGQSAVTGQAANTTATSYGNLLALGAFVAVAGAGALVFSKKKEILA